MFHSKNPVFMQPLSLGHVKRLKSQPSLVGSLALVSHHVFRVSALGSTNIPPVKRAGGPKTPGIFGLEQEGV